MTTKACISGCIFYSSEISRESLRLTHCELTSHGSWISVTVSSPDPSPVAVSISTSCSDLVSLPGPDPVSFRPWSYPSLSSWSSSLTDPIPFSGRKSFTYIEGEDEWQCVNSLSSDFGWFYSRHLHWRWEWVLSSAATSKHFKTHQH